MAQYDDLNVSRIFTVGVLAVVVTSVTALAVQVFYFSLTQWHLEAKNANSTYHRQNLVLSEQADRISVYGVDGETGNITIPIDKAIELVVAESKETEKKDAEKKAANVNAQPNEA
ncbi:hypothetical protein Pla52o_17860 [Novipirellula galeiformis]|uniref:Uncharacterized protein n=1 Tax=Novipirellula galeiformis TaxID=2528004 RepID=A0A5C6CFY9_9BACT|nr:hypothetical protein [Novipirellula galeiformis]TWU23863.1 hypothetical protein Pla52o_17860 [Novipirellula galeiformis]